MKRILTISLCCLGAIALVSSCGNNAKKSASSEAEAEAKADSTAVADSLAAAEKTQLTMETISKLPEEPIFDIVTSMGVIKVKLYAKTPKHRENFEKLALEKFYDGVLFHRVINGFMIQTGDPLTKDPANKAMYGTGGPDYTVPAEFVDTYKHKKGALAAARRGDAANPKKESSGSQFYIVQDPVNCAALDGDYTVFGETVEGLDVIDNIAKVETDGRDCPIQDIKIITIKLDDKQ